MKAAQKGMDDRLEVLERRMETVPDARTMHTIELSLTELRGDMKAVFSHMDGMETSISGMKAQINLLVQHHLENSKT